MTFLHGIVSADNKCREIKKLPVLYTGSRFAIHFVRAKLSSCFSYRA